MSDPSNPKVGDRFHRGRPHSSDPAAVLTIVADLGGGWFAVGDNSSGRPYCQHIGYIQNFWTPIPPPLITEPVVLWHWTESAGTHWGLRTFTAGLATGRRIELRPDGTWSEVTP